MKKKSLHMHPVMREQSHQEKIRRVESFLSAENIPVYIFMSKRLVEGLKAGRQM